MIFNRIVVAFDGSELAFSALRKAVEFARADSRVEIHIVNVIIIDTQTYMSYMSPFGGEASYVDPEQVKEINDERVMIKKNEFEATIADTIAAVRDQITIEFVFGVAPADEIISYAEDHEADCIIMGCRGLGAVRGMLGSVSYAVIRSAGTSVLIVK